MENERLGYCGFCFRSMIVTWVQHFVIVPSNRAAALWGKLGGKKKIVCQLTPSRKNNAATTNSKYTSPVNSTRVLLCFSQNYLGVLVAVSGVLIIFGEFADLVSRLAQLLFGFLQLFVFLLKFFKAPLELRWSLLFQPPKKNRHLTSQTRHTFIYTIRKFEFS